MVLFLQDTITDAETSENVSIISFSSLQNQSRLFLKCQLPPEMSTCYFDIFPSRLYSVLVRWSKLFFIFILQLSFQRKVGVMYCMAGQSSEEEMYNNEAAGPALEEFLHLLGDRVRLKGFSKYRAQLDTKSMCMCKKCQTTKVLCQKVNNLTKARPN